MLSVKFLKNCFGKQIIGRRLVSSVTHPDPGPESKTAKFLSENAGFLSHTYARPNLVFVKGENAHLWDLEERKFIDFGAGIAVTALGHSNPKVSEILGSQSSQLVHSSNLFYNAPAAQLSKQLVEQTKKHNGMHNAANVFLANSGTEANEAALKFARKYGKLVSEDKSEFITFKNSFHGRTLGALSVTPNPKYQKPFSPLVPGVHVATAGDISSVEKVISDKTCGVIIEPIQGEGGVRPVSADFLIQLRRLANKHNAILIYDEIQCGLGRSGKLWAHSYLPEKAHPDIFTTAKALGNGFPIAATVVSSKIEQSLKPGDHGTTYGGNPLGAKVGLYVLSELSKPEFLASVEEKGKLLYSKLEALQTKHLDKINEVRGKGLILGVEFKQDPSDIVIEARKRGLLVISAGGNVIRFVPALTINPEVLEEGVEIFDNAIQAAFP